MPVSKVRHRKCQQCGKDYELGVDSSQHKYCSLKCRNDWHYNKWKSSGGLRDKVKIRSYWLKHTYGITIEDYENLLEAQGNRCAICGITEPSGYNWHVDHCHSKGHIRGLLCSKCNQGLGLFNDNTEVMRNAIKYLEDRNESI